MNFRTLEGSGGSVGSSTVAQQKGNRRQGGVDAYANADAMYR